VAFTEVSALTGASLLAYLRPALPAPDRHDRAVGRRQTLRPAAWPTTASVGGCRMPVP
jgi:hypothetical protein